MAPRPDGNLGELVHQYDDERQRLICPLVALCQLAGTAPVAAYQAMRRDADRLHALAREAGKSLAEGEPGFDAELRKELARRARIALERLPVKDLQRIAYCVGFKFSTLTQDPADTGRASSLVYWLNPVYKHGTAEVVQSKALERWNDLGGPEERVKVLCKEADLRMALKKAGHTTPPAARKYGELPGYPELRVVGDIRLRPLGERITRAAWELAWQSDEQHSDLVADIMSNIKEASRNVAIDDLVETLAGDPPDDGPGHRPAVVLSPEGEALADKVGDKMAAAVMVLPGELRRVAMLMLDNPAAYTTGTGKVKVTKLAADLGCDWHRARGYVDQIAALLKVGARAAAGMA